MNDKLAAFALAVLEESRHELCDLDGGWLQDKAEELGLLVRVTVTEPCGENCRCAEYGDWPIECLQYSPEVVATIDAAKEKGLETEIEAQVDMLLMRAEIKRLRSVVNEGVERDEAVNYILAAFRSTQSNCLEDTATLAMRARAEIERLNAECNKWFAFVDSDDVWPEDFELYNHRWRLWAAAKDHTQNSTKSV